MSNYELIYTNAIKNIILNIAEDFITNGEFPDDIEINRNTENIEVKYKDLVIFTLYRATEINNKDLVIKLLDYIIYL